MSQSKVFQVESQTFQVAYSLLWDISLELIKNEHSQGTAV